MQEKCQMDSDHRGDERLGLCKCWDIVANGYRKWCKQIEGNDNEAEGSQQVSLKLLELAD
jgi:hypothetical protein